MLHTFMLVILLQRFDYPTAGLTSVTVGPYYMAQTCIASKEAVRKQGVVVDAFCVEVDRPHI